MNLKARSINFAYKKERSLFSDFSAEFESGKITAVCGPNGSGKSTLLKILAGIAKPESGNVFYDQTSIDSLTKMEVARKIAYLSGFTQPHFPLTVTDFVSQGRFCHQGIFSNMSADDRRIVSDALTEVGLHEIRNRPITELSLGQFQLSLFARAFAQSPDTYLLDEAFSNLDLNHQSLIWNLLLKRNGATIVFVTHDLNFSASRSDKLLWLVNGSILNYDDTEKSFTNENLEKAFPMLGLSKSGPYRIEKNPANGKPVLFLP